MKIRSIFYNDEPRLRAGWRLLLQTLLLFLFTFILGLPLVFLIAFNPSLGNSLFINQIITFFGVTGSVMIARRFFDRRSIVSLGLRIDTQALLDLGVGILIPMFMMGLIYLIISGVGWLNFQGFAWQEQSFGTVIFELLGIFFVFVLVGWSEELLSRGYHLQTLESGLNLIWGVLLSSAVFGFMHLANPNVNSIWSVAGGIFLAGVFLAFGYLRTRQLWLPIGLHIGWNFFEGVVFGFPVSGLESYRLIIIAVHGPQIWTGGAFGPEAGLVLIPALILGFVLVYLYTRGRLIQTELT